MLNTIILLTTITINLSLALTIVIKKRNDLKDSNLIFFVLGIFFLAVWAVFNYLADTALSVESSLFWTRTTFPTSILGIYFIMIFSFYFPTNFKKRSKYVGLSFLIATVFFSIVAMSSSIVAELALDVGIGITDVKLGNLYPAIIIFYLALISNIIINLSKKFVRLKGEEKMQISYVIFGWVLFILGAISTNLILPYITSNAVWSKFGPLFSIIMVTATTYAIIKYKFLDIRIIIQKGLVYTSSLAVFVVLYLSLVSFFGVVFKVTTDTTIFLSAGLTTLMGIFGMPHVKNRFNKMTDKFFFRDTYNYAEAIHDLSTILNRNLYLEVLEKELKDKIKTLLKPSKINFYLDSKKTVLKTANYLQKTYNPQETIYHVREIEDTFGKDETSDDFLNSIKELKRDNIVLVVALKIRNEIIGLITLGSKLSEEPYSSTDLNLLKSLSYQIATSIEKALLFEQVKEHSEELERKVEERTREIKKLQSEQKQVMLDISHGLQTPMTVIKSELEHLQAQSPENKNLTVFETSINRISKFISDLLSLSKLETKQEDIVKEKIDLSLLFEEMAEYFSVILEDNQIDFSASIEKNIFIRGNKDKIEELMHSLVSNSMKYIGEGNRITLTLKKENNKVIIMVKDDGIGIAQEEQEKVFSRFYRAKNNNNTGSGLGLSICKKIVELHGGEMNIESKIGRGTKINVVVDELK